MTRKATLLVANSRILIVRRVLRDPSILQPSLIGPLIRILSLPRPLDPASPTLESHRLGLPILSEEFLVIRTECCAIARFAGTAANIVGSGIRSVVTTSCSATIEVFGTIGGSGGPFSDDRV